MLGRTPGVQSSASYSKPILLVPYPLRFAQNADKVTVQNSSRPGESTQLRLEVLAQGRNLRESLSSTSASNASGLARAETLVGRAAAEDEEAE